MTQLVGLLGLRQDADHQVGRRQSPFRDPFW
jgi:hypothetical protein